MGNNSNSQTANVAQKFKNTCHQGLSDCFYDASQQMLVAPVKIQEGMQAWQKDVDPLMKSHHLFLPFKYINYDNQRRDGCCMMDDPSLGLRICHVFYLPFFYTLEKEIISRRQKNSFFKEQQIWKLMKYLSKGVAEWMTVYPQQKLGVLCPSNILINPQGQVRIVTKISFFLQVYASMNQYYIPPESRQTLTIKNTLNPNRDSRAIEASLIYSIGAVLLQVATLTLVDYQDFGQGEKQQTLKGLHYSWQLKEILASMLDPISMRRITLRQILQLSKLNKSKH